MSKVWSHSERGAASLLPRPIILFDLSRRLRLKIAKVASRSDKSVKAAQHTPRAITAPIPKFAFYTSKVHLPAIRLSGALQFRQALRSILLAAMAPGEAQPWKPLPRAGLRKIQPYWFAYTTMAKERWLGREILEVVSTEFRDRSVEYYVSQLPLSVVSYLNLTHKSSDMRWRAASRASTII